MSTPASATTLLARLEEQGAPELRRLLVENLTKCKLGLYWGKRRHRPRRPPTRATIYSVRKEAPR